MTTVSKTIHGQIDETLSKLSTITKGGKHFATYTTSMGEPEYKQYAKGVGKLSLNDNITHSDTTLATIEEEIRTVRDKAPTMDVVVGKPDPIGFELWEALAYDLALENATPEVIADAYCVTVDQINELKQNNYFDKMLRAKQEEVKQLGSDAAFIVKMRMVANRATPQFLQRLTSSATNNKDFHALFKTAVELAQLIPQDDNNDAAGQAVIGASVTFNIQGVPGLDHLSTKISTDTPTPTTPLEVTDAEFTEIVDYQSNKLSTDIKLAEL